MWIRCIDKHEQEQVSGWSLFYYSIKTRMATNSQGIGLRDVKFGHLWNIRLSEITNSVDLQVSLWKGGLSDWVIASIALVKEPSLPYILYLSQDYWAVLYQANKWLVCIALIEIHSLGPFRNVSNVMKQIITHLDLSSRIREMTNTEDNWWLGAHFVKANDFRHIAVQT